MAEEGSLLPGESKIYQLMKMKGALTDEEISQKTGLAKSTVNVYVSSMRKKGINITRNKSGDKYFFELLLTKEKVTPLTEGRREISKKPAVFVGKSPKKIKIFTDVLRKNIRGYDGIHSDIIKYVPQFFELFQNLSGKKDLDADTKSLVNSVVSYFVLPREVIPEDEWGAFGYIDDLYLSAYVVNKLKVNEEKRKMIKEYWEGEENIFELAADILRKIESTPDETLEKALLEEVLDFVGLKNKELSDAEIKEIWEQRPSEERTCHNCGKKLSRNVKPWTRYCDICAEEVYGPAKSVTSEINKLLLKMRA